MIFDIDEAIDHLQGFVVSLLGIVQETETSRNVRRGEERLNLWADRVTAWLRKEISGRTAARFLEVTTPLKREASARFALRFQAYHDHLVALITDMQDDPEHWEDVMHSSDDEGDLEDGAPCVFVAHGRSPHWALVQRFLETDLGLEVLAFESESRAGQHIVEVLDSMLGEADFAVIVLTAEDATEKGSLRARQNVVHEAGLAQGKLGHRRAVLVVQEGLEEFSNIAGLQQLRFRGDAIQQVFEGLRTALAREGLI